MTLKEPGLKSSISHVPADLDFQAIEDIEDLPVIVLSKVVLFPGATLPLTDLSSLTRKQYAAACQGQLKLGLIVEVGLGDQEEPSDELESPPIFAFGTEVTVSNCIKLASGKTCLIVKGMRRFFVNRMDQSDSGYKAHVTIVDDVDKPQSAGALAAATTLKNLIQQILRLHPSIDHETITTLYASDEPKVLCDSIVPQLSLTIEEKLTIFSTFRLLDRIKLVLKAATREIDLLKLSHKIQEDIKGEMHEGLRRNFLKEQISAIRRELGEEASESEVDDLATSMAEMSFPDAVQAKVEQELKRLKAMHPSAPDYHVAINYLTWLKDLPWPSTDSQEQDEDDFSDLNIHNAAQQLDRDHFGIQEVKDRVLEFLAVIKHRGNHRGDILLFNGPPGVGKTSLGRSIAKALDRPFQRIALGGVKDEAEIRGHRRTYIGALPGKIIQAIKECGSSQCVILLDEIDKAGQVGSSDICSALLEVLDPEQNCRFVDHYLAVPFDLSHVLFIATSNNFQEIPAPLFDRMEPIHLFSYTQQEKTEIAHRHLVPRVRAELGLPAKSFRVNKKALKHIISSYTREAGVRSLNRNLQKLGRKMVHQMVVAGEPIPGSVDEATASNFLGVPSYLPESHEAHLAPGIAVGLAYTSVGGDILYIESSFCYSDQAEPRLVLTGRLGEVMKESAQTAFSYVRAHLSTFGLKHEDMKNRLFHVHVPDGATPKDGPSAGVAILCSLVSLLTNKSLRRQVAMTGEVTLRGNVLPVGGIKEKVLAAHQNGKKIILLPLQNILDLRKIDQKVLKTLTVYPVRHLQDALEITGLVGKNAKKHLAIDLTDLSKDPAEFDLGQYS